MAVVASQRQIAGVTVAAGVGTFLEFFDWFVAAQAAGLVWPIVFFPQSNPAIALLLSILTLSLGFFLRPVGAFIFGHIGDRHGRKSTLIWTLILMGVATVGIGLTPGYSALGILAVALLFVFRIIQGIGVGGEFGGASTWILEMAEKSKWRAFLTSWVQTANLCGAVAASTMFTALVASMSQTDFLNYGWRIPFYVGAVLVVAGILIRHRTDESPLFEELRQKRATVRVPAADLIKKHWRRVLICAGILGLTAPPVYLIAFSQGFIQAAYGVPRVVAAFGYTLGTAVGVVTMIIGGLLANAVGRRRLLLIAEMLTLIIAIPTFLLFSTAVPALVYIGYAFLGSFNSLGFAVLASYFPEQFPTAVRYSGAGLGYSIGTAFMGGLAPLVAASIFVVFGNASGIYIGLMLMGFVAISVVATLLSKEAPKDTLRF